MRKEEIYHIIDELLHQSKEIKRSKGTIEASELVSNYCNEFMLKNKLMPRKRNDKIKEILKEFEVLDSFIDVHKIIRAIHNYISTKLVESKQGDTKKQVDSATNLLVEPDEPISKYELSLQKASKLIRSSYGEGHYMELNRCAEMLECLEKNSNELNNIKIKNSCPEETFHNLINKRYCESSKNVFDLDEESIKIDDIDGYNGRNCRGKESPWKMLEERKLMINPVGPKLTNEDEQTDLLTFLNPYQPSHHMKKSENKFEYLKMLHASATYLHFILEKEFNQKWAVKKAKNCEEHSKKPIPKIETFHENEEIEGIFSLKETSKKSKTIHVDTERETDNEGNIEDRREQNNLGNFISSRKSKFSRISTELKHNSQPKEMKKYVNLERLSKLVHKTEMNESFRSTATEIWPKITQNKTTFRTKKSVHFISMHSKNDLTPEVEITMAKSNTFPESLKSSFHKSKPRMTFHSVNNLSLIKKIDKENLERYDENKKIREKFTFMKRGVKERVLKKITEFVNDVEYAEKTMNLESENCEKQLQSIQDKMEFEYSGFKSEKLINDEKAIEGVRSALNKLSSNLKKPEK